MPKKPRAAFCIFNTQYMEQLRAQDPNLKVTECFKMAGTRWSEMSDSDKSIYNKLADQDKVLY